MKRGLLLLLVLAGVGVALHASAQVSRFIVEDGDGGTYTAAANPSRLRGQGPTSFISYACAANACTRSAPSTASSPPEGILLSGLGSYIVTLEVNSGTFSGGGAAEIWLYVDDSGGSGPAAKWYYVIGKDIIPTSGKSAVMTMVQTVSLRPGNYRMVVRPNAVTTSAATPTLTVSVRGCLTATCAP
jgi:hypothetical protein